MEKMMTVKTGVTNDKLVIAGLISCEVRLQTQPVT